jgi:hypothetical protein
MEYEYAPLEDKAHDLKDLLLQVRHFQKKILARGCMAGKIGIQEI